MREAYLLLTNTGSALSAAIKVVTRHPYNHISIAFDRELKEVYSFGRRQPTNPFVGGFVREDLTSEFFRDATCQIYTISMTEKEYNHLRALIRLYEEDALHYHYNFAGLFTIWMGIEWNRNRHYFCSQFVGDCLNRVGVLELNTSPSLIYPQDIVDLLNAKLVYEGLLASYLGLPLHLTYIQRMLRVMG